MTNSLKSRKALNFDIDSMLLKRFYPSNNYRKGWTDIKIYLERYNFIHRQYSGYVSKENIEMTEVINIVIEMSKQFTWLRKCVREFDVIVVNDEYSLIDNINYLDPLVHNNFGKMLSNKG